MTSSMTGFGDSKQTNKETEIYCEIKSVNHKFLDLNLKGYELSPKLDKKVRNTFNKSIKRGSVDIKFKLTNAFTYDYQINIQSLNKFKKKLNINITLTLHILSQRICSFFSHIRQFHLFRWLLLLSHI